MRHSLLKNENYSVLNTDAFDKRRYREVFEMSSGLQKVRGDCGLPLFEHLLADIWASLYKMRPKIRDGEVESYLVVNELIMKKIMTEPHFINNRRFTRLDELASAIGTLKFGEKIIEWLADQKELATVLQKKTAEIQAILGQLQKQGNADEAGKGSVTLQGDLKEAVSELEGQLQQALNDDGQGFSKAMEQAMQETKQTKDHLASLLGGTRAGSGEAELKKVPLRDAISLAEKIASNKHMKEIANWAGRFKQIARKKQKTKQTDSMERNGVTVGNDIERLLPMELVLYTHPITKNDFLRRLVEGQTNAYEQKGHEVLGKGPIVLCLDQSGSMQRLDTQAKGFALALMSIARKQRRDFCLILFSTRTQIFKYERGKINTSDMINLARTFLGGGTDFTLPLDKAMHVINKSRFKQADVVFVTDGEDREENRVKDSFLEVFNKKKKEKKFNVLSLTIGCSTQTVKQFSDKVVQVENFDDNGILTAFDI